MNHGRKCYCDRHYLLQYGEILTINNLFLTINNLQAVVFTYFEHVPISRVLMNSIISLFQNIFVNSVNTQVFLLYIHDVLIYISLVYICLFWNYPLSTIKVHTACPIKVIKVLHSLRVKSNLIYTTYHVRKSLSI